MGFKGIDIRQSGGSILFRESLKDATGMPVIAGATTLSIYQLQSNGTLYSYDFNNNTFTSGAVTTISASMTMQTGANSTINTGIWTYNLATVTGFTVGNIIFYTITNLAASPPSTTRQFQYGNIDGDQNATVVGSSSYLDTNIQSIVADTTSPIRLKNLLSPVGQGTVDTSTFTATTTTFETSFTTNKDLFTNEYLYFASGVNQGFTTKISHYLYSVYNKVRITTCDTLPTAPSNSDIFIIIGKGI